VGDPHVKIGNLKESESLMGFVLSEALRLKVDRLEILGDLFDTHALVRLEILEFWQRWLTAFSEQPFKTIALVGNHDVPGDYSSQYSALHPFLLIGGNLKIVYKPYLNGKYGYLPYIHNNNDFIEQANELANQGATVLVSHPNFEGAVYDNGVGILGAVSPDLLSHGLLHLIGGHIHTFLELGRVLYIGTPRWLTKSCSNKKKGIWLFNHDDQTGSIISKEFISTECICTPFISLTWKEGEEKPIIPERSKVDIELIGSSEWVSKSKKELIGSVSVSSKITDIKKSRERKSGKSLHEYLSTHYQTNKREKLLNYMKEQELFD